MEHRKYLTRKEVAEKYPVAYSTLAHLAMQGRGPRYMRVGKNTVYRIDEVEAWFEEQVIGPLKTTLRKKRKLVRNALSNQIENRQK